MPRSNLPDAFYFQVFDVKPGKSEKRKLEILEAAIDCMAKIGFERTTFDLIGKQVGMHRAHVNYYFTSRDELIRAAVRYAVAIGQQITISHVQKAKGWKGQLKAVVEGPFEWLARYPKHAVVMVAFYQLCTYDPDYSALQGTIRAGGEARILACFERLMEDGKLNHQQAVELSRAIQAVMTGNILYAYTCQFPLTLPRLKAWTVKLALEMVENAQK